MQRDNPVAFVATFVATFVHGRTWTGRGLGRLDGRVMFPRAKLNVYRKALAFVADTAVFVKDWDKRHAVVEQFVRASESRVLNLAEGARLCPGRAKLRALHHETLEV